MNELIVIAGPTASGKTSLGIELARKLGGEIVSADSQQVYQHFDIGTAKPSRREMAEVPHHLVSAVDPLELFSAARYQELADATISDIHKRGKQAIIVGGTGLYIRALLHGLMPAPPRDSKLRARLVEEAKEKGNEALHRRLSTVDPDAASRIQVADLVRIVRALEINELTGRPASEHRRGHEFAIDRYAYRLFVLNPERAELYAAIDRRVRRLFAAGLVQEVDGLIRRGFREAAAMRSVGYAEALSVVEGRLTVEQAIELAARATRNYAKRQLTWFRKEPKAEFIAPRLETLMSQLSPSPAGGRGPG